MRDETRVLVIQSFTRFGKTPRLRRGMFILEGTVKIDLFPFPRSTARRAAHQLRAQRSGAQLEARSSKMSA